MPNKDKWLNLTIAINLLAFSAVIFFFAIAAWIPSIWVLAIAFAIALNGALLAYDLYFVIRHSKVIWGIILAVILLCLGVLPYAETIFRGVSWERFISGNVDWYWLVREMLFLYLVRCFFAYTAILWVFVIFRLRKSRNAIVANLAALLLFLLSAALGFCYIWIRNWGRCDFVYMLPWIIVIMFSIPFFFASLPYLVQAFRKKSDSIN